MAKIHLQRNAGKGQPFLAVEYLPAEYSTVTLEYFYPDWRGYKQLVLEMTNPESTDIRVVLRIHDRLHKLHHFDLNDRFNRSLLLKPGCQRIDIAIADVEKAPVSRKMDLQHMEELSLFTIGLTSIRHVDIHTVYLE